MKCPNCKNEVPEGKRFCGYCGHALTPVRDAFDDDAVTLVDETPSRSEDEFGDGTQTTLADEPKMGIPTPEVLKAKEKPITSQTPANKLPTPAQRRGTQGWVWGVVLLVGVIVVMIVIGMFAWNFFQPNKFGNEVIASGTGDFRAAFDVTLEAKGKDGGYICPIISQPDITAWAFIKLSEGSFAIRVTNWATDEKYYPSAWKNVAEINTGIGETNHIEIVAQDNRLTWFINGVSVAEFDYPTIDSKYEYEFKTCEPRVKILLENITVEELP